MSLEIADEVLEAPPVEPSAGERIGASREGRPIRAFRFGRGPRRVSLLAGCHADEPVGPRLLRRLVSLLRSRPADDPLLEGYEWWICPHANPDGAARNESWHSDHDEEYDAVRYLHHVVREAPGDDMEFGFPREESDTGARPENQSLYRWWRSAGGPFSLHVSLHGMAFAGGPWFLIGRNWADRSALLMESCRFLAESLGYRLHDVDRQGEKGFHRIARGFSTCPTSGAMAEYFRRQGDEATAFLFRPSSMETIQSFGGLPLTLVSEIPLFVLPGVGDTVGPPDPLADRWKGRIQGWKARLDSYQGTDGVRREIEDSGLTPVPVNDALRLQWNLVAAGVETVS